MSLEADIVVFALSELLQPAIAYQKSKIPMQDHVADLEPNVNHCIDIDLRPSI